MHLENQVPDLIVGIVIAKNVTIAPASSTLDDALNGLIEARKQPAGDDEATPGGIKDQVRALLRAGGFKPSGRNKPASEYLAQAAREGRFPRINNLVDVNNLISLASGLPISLLDLSVTTERLRLRCGKPDESYVFNAGGQIIELSGLVSICAIRDDGDEPLGNPVKDSMKGKISSTTKSVVGVLYAPKSFGEPGVRQHLQTFADWLGREGNSTEVAIHLA